MGLRATPQSKFSVAGHVILVRRNPASRSMISEWAVRSGECLMVHIESRKF
jgi:hypothetical protein